MAATMSEVFNFMQGSDITGESSYDIWKAMNPEGTPEEFLEFIRGGSGESGVSSWNDLTDKPFYEEVVSTDTNIWDGNTKDHLIINNDYGISFIKISDVVPTIDDCSNGIIEFIDENDTYGVTSTVDYLQQSINNRGYIATDNGTYIIPTDNYNDQNFLITFPEAGIWLCDYSGQGTFSFVSKIIKIPGYTGFNMTNIKTIDEKYLPDSHSWDNLKNRPFGESVISLGNVLRWDGNTTGLVTNIADTPVLYKISDNIPSVDDIKNGGKAGIKDYRGNTNSENLNIDLAVEQLNTNGYFIWESYLAIITEDNTNTESYGVFPEKGIYFFSRSYGYRGEYFIINDYNFTKLNIELIDEKFIPDTIVRKSDLGNIDIGGGGSLDKITATDTTGILGLTNAEVNAQELMSSVLSSIKDIEQIIELIETI